LKAKANNRWSRLKFGFFAKITAHIILMTLFTGIVIAGLTAYQFRKEIYRQEHNSAFTVYAAIVNYVTGHYRSHNDYIPHKLEYVLSKKFLHVDELSEPFISHRPAHLILYDEEGKVVYEYREADHPGPLDAQPIPIARLPVHIEQTPHHENGFIQIFGPIAQLDNAPGYLWVSFPTVIEAQIERLLLQCFAFLLLVLSVTLLLSLFFTRQVLAPIKALTHAARMVHRGSLEQEVPVVTDDEIGELTETFNEMIDSMSRRMEFMHRMQEWTVRIGRQLNTQRLFEILGEMFERMSSSDSYRLYLMDAVSGDLDIRLEKGAERLPHADQDRLARMAIKERWTMYLMQDGTSDSEPGDVVELAIPLLSGKSTIGVIRIGRKHDQSLYDDDTLTILQTLAQHASVAIDNANLYERLSEQERIAQEMLLAREIQQSMLPRIAPSLPGYTIAGGSTPALEVGGDYFDFVTNNGDCYLVIGDVSGKGVPAALIMSIVRALIHTYLEFMTSPEQVMRKVNRNISNDLDPEMFVTMSTIQLETQSHRIHFVRAGHEPLLLLRRDGSLESISPPGTALGMLDPDMFDDMMQEEYRDLEQGDTVLLYTDGITEAQNTQHEEYGLERLQKLLGEKHDLPVNDLYDAIMHDVQRFTTGVQQHDDITLIILRRTGPSSPA